MPLTDRIVKGFTLVCFISTVGLAQWPPAVPSYQTGFPVEFDNNGDHVRSSSIVLADLDGDTLPEIVVGTADGRVQAYDGDGSKLWQYPPAGGGDMAFEGKAAVADIDGDGFPEVVIGAGSTFTRSGTGQLYVLSHTGTLQCSFAPRELNGTPDGIASSPALADLDENDGGKLEIVFGSWDTYVYVLHDDCSLYWEKEVRDSIWSSPAIGDLDRDGHLEIVIGVDAHWEPNPINTEDGGILHAYRRDGSAELPGFPIQIDEVIFSSPAIGDIDGDGSPDIVVGTGRCWDDPACAPTVVHPGVGEYVNAWDVNGNYLTGWPVAVAGQYAGASPSLADIDEDGTLEVVINTIDKTTGDGTVYVLNGDGSAVAGWPQQPSTPADCSPANNVHAGTNASAIVSDVDGDTHLEIILASNWELVIWDRDGNQLTRDAACPEPPGDLILVTTFTVNSAAAVGDLDDDGDLEVVVGGGGTSIGTSGALYAWDFAGTASPEATPWPQFRRSQDNHSNADPLIFADGFESEDVTSWSSSVGAP